MRLPGYGDDGFGEGMPFKRMEEFYLKMVANIAAGDKVGEEVPHAMTTSLKSSEKPENIYIRAYIMRINGTELL
ncbi:MAG: hypothetical protein NXY59_06445 [Aigarchaeota archaeon]|nr:hypothetical protein [Candidatus Pelearchaeum maunauluense]